MSGQFSSAFANKAGFCQSTIDLSLKNSVSRLWRWETLHEDVDKVALFDFKAPGNYKKKWRSENKGAKGFEQKLFKKKEEAKRLCELVVKTKPFDGQIQSSNVSG